MMALISSFPFHILHEPQLHSKAVRHLRLCSARSLCPFARVIVLLSVVKLHLQIVGCYHVRDKQQIGHVMRDSMEAEGLSDFTEVGK